MTTNKAAKILMTVFFEKYAFMTPWAAGSLPALFRLAFGSLPARFRLASGVILRISQRKRALGFSLLCWWSFSGFKACHFDRLGRLGRSQPDCEIVLQNLAQTFEMEIHWSHPAP